MLSFEVWSCFYVHTFDLSVTSACGTPVNVGSWAERDALVAETRDADPSALQCRQCSLIRAVMLANDLQVTERVLGETMTLKARRLMGEADLRYMDGTPFEQGLRRASR